MTKDVPSLPHLLRGEELSSCVPWESEPILFWGPRPLGPSASSFCPDSPPARRASFGFCGASWKLRSDFQAHPDRSPSAMALRAGLPLLRGPLIPGPRVPGPLLVMDPLVSLPPDFLAGDFRLERDAAGYEV